MARKGTEADLKRSVMPPGKLLVRVVQADEFAPGGVVYLPEESRAKRNIAAVIKMGKAPRPGSTYDAGIHEDLVLGDWVMFGKYSTDETAGQEFGREFGLDYGVGVHVLNETEVLMIVKRKKGRK